MLKSDVAAMRLRFSTTRGMVAASAGMKNWATALAMKIRIIMVVAWTATVSGVVAMKRSVRMTRSTLL